MNAQDLPPLVESFQPVDEHERTAKERTIAFLKRTGGIPWSRKNFDDGHVCASSWILDHEGRNALLFHHKKLGIWVQIGGHIEEGDPDFFAAVLREVREETGLTDVEYEREIFDMDVHVYPPRGDEPEHIHYDVRVLVRAKPGAETQVQAEEGHALRWVPLAEIETMNTDESVLHSARKSMKGAGA